MKATDVVKSWKDLSGFVYDRVTGSNKEHYSESDWELINSEGAKLMKDIGIDEIHAKAKKLMALNILDKKVSFKDFENMPAVWAGYYKTSMDVVSSEVGQVI